MSVAVDRFLPTRYDLDLFQFPADVQDLTISITSHHHVETCLLVQDGHFRSSINREAFVDQQKWSLYEHVATEMRQTQEEYSFDDENNSKEPKKHPVLSVTCRAGLTNYLDDTDEDSLITWSSSSAWVLLLECILSDLPNYCHCILCFLHHPEVNATMSDWTHRSHPHPVSVYLRIACKSLVLFYWHRWLFVGSSIDHW